MRQLAYANAAIPLHFAFPAEWDASLVTVVSLTVKDRAGTALMAAANSTLYTATTLLLAADRFAGSFKMAADATTVVAGDRLRLYGVSGSESVTVKGFDATTKIVTIEGILENEYAVGDTVRGLFGNYTLDVSTVATYTAGIMLTLLWTPTGDGQPVTEYAQVAKSALDISGLERRFSYLYPRCYESFTKPVDRFADMAIEAELQVGQELLSEGLDIQRLINPDGVSTVVMARMAFLWTLNGDDDMNDERIVLGGEYERQLGWLRNAPVWTDDDQDLVEDTGEVTDHQPIFGKGW